MNKGNKPKTNIAPSHLHVESKVTELIEAESRMVVFPESGGRGEWGDDWKGRQS
jgi:hypothetical protein